MKPLILITSCLRDKQRGYHQAIRETWAAHSPDYRFILGAGNTVDAPDELVFDIADTHATCTYKTKMGHKWAAENGYGSTLQVFSDTYVNVPAIMTSDFDLYDYVGFVKGHPPDMWNAVPDRRGWYNYCSGGPGYWLSERATAAVAASDPGECGLMEWAEDLWVGTTVGRAGYYAHSDKRYILDAQWFLDAVKDGRVRKQDVFGMHLGRGTGVFEPQWMYDAHAILS